MGYNPRAGCPTVELLPLASVQERFRMAILPFPMKQLYHSDLVITACGDGVAREGDSDNWVGEDTVLCIIILWAPRQTLCRKMSKIGLK